MIIIKIFDKTIVLIIEFVLLLLLSIIILSSTKYNTLKTECFKAYPYTNGFIYIGDKECINSIEKEESKLIIQDARKTSNPDMKIYDSYKINSEKIQKEVIEKLLYYEENHPTDWKRSKKSMVNEWYAHNLLYNMNLKRERTRDVDLDNSDEEVFKEKLGVNTLIKYFSK